MPNDKEHFVGIDIAKDWFDVAVLGEKRTKQFANTKRGIAELVKWMRILNSKLIVVEATGGYEEALVLALFEAGLPVALVSPQQVRHCREAACSSQRTPDQDGPVGCPTPGRVRKNHPAAPVCRQERGAQTAFCSGGTAQPAE